MNRSGGQSLQRHLLSHLASAQPPHRRHRNEIKAQDHQSAVIEPAQTNPPRSEHRRETTLIVDNQGSDEFHDTVSYEEIHLKAPEHFNERYKQEQPPSRSSRSNNPTGRARSSSVPPGSEGSDKKHFGNSHHESTHTLAMPSRTVEIESECELDAGMSRVTRRDMSRERKGGMSQTMENNPDIEYGEVIQGSQMYNQPRLAEDNRLTLYVNSDFNGSPRTSKRVSYAHGQPGRVPTRNASPTACRLRADCVETDESDMSFTGAPTRRTMSRSAENLHQSQVKASGSGSKAMPMGYAIDDYLNQTNNNSAVALELYEATMRRNGSSNGLCKDVHPLPIEIPDNVTDIDAFQRYLTVRRGAIKERQIIPFASQNRTSYESLGRRPRRRSSVGVSPNGRLGNDASKRTASLSHAIMTLALLSASICQLRFLITYAPAHSFPLLNYFLIFTSIILEVAAGIGYVVVARCSFDEAQSETIHNYLIVALFIVAVSNVVLAAFAFDDHICEEIRRAEARSSNASPQDQQINQPVPRPDRVMDLRYMPLE